MIKFYCPHCGEPREVRPLVLTRDKLNKEAWCDAVCIECCLVIATISSDKEGSLVFKEG